MCFRRSRLESTYVNKISDEQKLKQDIIQVLPKILEIIINHVGTQYTRIQWPPRCPKQRPQARHLQGCKDREEGLQPQEFPTQLLFTQTATAAPKKQHWASAPLSGRKELLTLLLSHYKESTERLAKGGIKERLALNSWKLQRFFSWLAKLRIVPASKVGLCPSSLWAQSDTGGNESLSQ